jgi:hypothetical protein
MRVSTDKQLSFGAAAGVGIGTVGLAAEWLWSHVWMTMSWPASMLPEALVFGVLAGVVGGVLGGYIGRSLIPAESRLQRGPRWLAPVMVVGVLACLAYPFPTNANLQAKATVRLSATDRPGWSDAEIQVAPADAAEDASWFNVTSWQGGGSRVRDLIPTGPGTYRTSGPVPITGDWKTLIRFQKGRTALALPIYLPEDPGIPAPEVPARDEVTRPFISDKEVVLREAKDVSSTLTMAASAVLGAIALFWVLVIAWGMSRLQPVGDDRRWKPPVRHALRKETT